LNLLVDKVNQNEASDKGRKPYVMDNKSKRVATLIAKLGKLQDEFEQFASGILDDPVLAEAVERVRDGGGEYIERLGNLQRTLTAWED